MNQFNKNLLSAFLIIVLTVINYLPSLNNGYIWDDNEFSGRGKRFHAKGIEGIKSIWLDRKSNPQYYPLLYTSFVADYHFWGDDLYYPHLINILLHSLVSLLLWKVLLLLKIPCALGVALCFALHPVHVESVSWLAERKNSLSGFFYMMSLYFFLKRFLKKTEKKELVQYFLSFFFFVLAMFTKTVTCTLPAVLIVLMLWKKDKDTKDLRESIFLVIPYFVLASILALQTILLEQNHAGAIGLEWDFSFWERFLIAGRAIFFYAGKLLFPINLTFIYPRWEINTDDIFQWLYPIFVLVFILVFWLKRKTLSNAPLVAFLIFCGSLFPALNFFNIYPMRFSFVADHFQYLSSISMITLLIVLIWKYISSHQAGRWLAPLCIGGILFSYSYTSQELQAQYKDEQTLWEKTLRKNPNVFLAYNNLGVIYHRQKLNKKAMSFYKKAAAIKPDYVTALYNIAKLYYLEGLSSKDISTHLKAHDYIKKAVSSLEADLQYTISKVGEPLYYGEYAQTYRLWGRIESALGNNEKGCIIFKELLDKLPGSYKTMNHLASCYLNDKDREEKGIELLTRSINMRPHQVKALTLLGKTYYEREKYKESIDYLLKAMKVDDQWPLVFYHLGKSYQAAKMKKMTVQSYKQFLSMPKINPELKKEIEVELKKLND